MFDFNSARQAGYGPSEIIGYLEQKDIGFDFDAARQAGYNDDEILGYMEKKKDSIFSTHATASPVVNTLSESIRTATRETEKSGGFFDTIQEKATSLLGSIFGSGSEMQSADEIAHQAVQERMSEDATPEARELMQNLSPSKEPEDSYRASNPAELDYDTKVNVDRLYNPYQDSLREMFTNLFTESEKDIGKEDYDRYLSSLKKVMPNRDVALDVDTGEVFVKDKGSDEEYRSIQSDSMWQNLKAGFEAYAPQIAYELGVDVASGGAAMRYAPKHPLAQSAAFLLGGTIGSTLFGTPAGVAAKKYVNYQNTGVDESAEDIGAEVLREMEDNVYGSMIGAGAVGGAVAGAKKAATAAEGAYNYLARENISGAKSILKDFGYTDEQVKKMVDDVERFQKTEDVSGKSKIQRDLFDVVYQDPILYAHLRNSIKDSPESAKKVMDIIGSRAENLSKQGREMSRDDFKSAIEDWEKQVGREYGETKELFREALPYYNFDREILDDVSAHVERMEKSVGDSDVKSELGALLYRINNQDEIYADDLVRVRQDINNVLGKNKVKKYDDKGALLDIKTKIDSLLEGALRKNTDDETTDQLLAQWKKVNKDYQEMRNLQDGYFYKNIFSENLPSEEQLDKLLLKVGESEIDDAAQLIDKLNPAMQKQAQARIVNSVVNNFIGSTKNNAKFVDWTNLSHALDSMKYKIEDKGLNEYISNIKKMGDIFKNDEYFLRAATNSENETIGNNISTTVTGKAKMWGATKIFEIITKYMPNKGGKYTALEHHLTQALEQSRTPKELAMKMGKIKNAPKSMLDELKPVIKFYNSRTNKTVDELMRLQKERERQAYEQSMREAQERAEKEGAVDADVIYPEVANSRPKTLLGHTERDEPIIADNPGWSEPLGNRIQEEVDALAGRRAAVMKEMADNKENLKKAVDYREFEKNAPDEKVEFQKVFHKPQPRYVKFDDLVKDAQEEIITYKKVFENKNKGKSPKEAYLNPDNELVGKKIFKAAHASDEQFSEKWTWGEKIDEEIVPGVELYWDKQGRAIREVQTGMLLGTESSKKSEAIKEAKDRIANGPSGTANIIKNGVKDALKRPKTDSNNMDEGIAEIDGFEIPIDIYIKATSEGPKTPIQEYKDAVDNLAKVYQKPKNPKYSKTTDSMVSKNYPQRLESALNRLHRAKQKLAKEREGLDNSAKKNNNIEKEGDEDVRDNVQEAHNGVQTDNVQDIAGAGKTPGRDGQGSTKNQNDDRAAQGAGDAGPRSQRDSGEGVYISDAGRDRGGELNTPKELKDSPTNPAGIRAPGEKPENFHIDNLDRTWGGFAAKYNANLEAINTLKKVEAQRRAATPQEQEALSRYVGWGGMPNVFDLNHKTWGEKAQELRSLLDDSEWESARASTYNAHFTDYKIVSSMWTALERLGFRGGRVLEPSIGVGNFISVMPKQIKNASNITGVELDSLSSRISQQLFPDAKIKNIGFQDFEAPNNYYDIVVGNPPFGNVNLYDPARKHLDGLSIHNFFFAKSLELLKPGGHMAMVVTNYLMDSAKKEARLLIDRYADLEFAVRLPNNAFSKNANTEVTTDVLVFRKRKPGEERKDSSWVDTVEMPDAKGGETIATNAYYKKHPQNMLGEWGRYGSMYAKDTPALIRKDSGDLHPEIIGRIQQDIMERQSEAAENFESALSNQKNTMDTDVAKGLKFNSLVDKDGAIYRFEKNDFGEGEMRAVDDLELIDVSPERFESYQPAYKKGRLTTIKRIKEKLPDLFRLRGRMFELKKIQLDPLAKDEEISAVRVKLNTEYDNYVKKHGIINLDENAKVLEGDPSWGHLSALEKKFDKKGASKKRKAVKSDIFMKRTQYPIAKATEAKNPKDALTISLYEEGVVNPERISSLLKTSNREAIRELENEGYVFQTPWGSIETRDQFLSGNVKAKLAKLQDAALRDEKYRKHVNELKKVIPKDIPATDINVKIGAGWLPESDMTEFIKDAFGSSTLEARYNKVTGEWSYEGMARSITESARQKYGTDRRSPLQILTMVSKNKQVKVYNKTEDGGMELDRAASDAANEKAERIKEAFQDWIWKSKERRERLGSLYNQLFNTDNLRNFDGSHLVFPGKISDDIVNLRLHQKNGVWRMLQEKTTLLDHTVGTGKTFTIVAGAMEMKRMGLANKPMIVVPNHIVSQWQREFGMLYPNANILAASDKDFAKKRRKRFMNMIVTGDWDAVIVPHSSFGLIPMSKEAQKRFAEEEVQEIVEAIRSMRESKGNPLTIKELEKMRDRKKEEMKTILDMKKDADSIEFEELGVDALFVDEAHEFKNLRYTTTMDKVAGMGDQKGSKKANDMFMKTRWIRENRDGKLVFATGTPISNSMVEMYTVMKYLDYERMKEKNWHIFDNWVNQFGEVSSEYEITPTGNFRPKSRLRKFVNMPELMQRYKSFADVVNNQDVINMLKEIGETIDIPNIKGGKPTNTVAKRSKQQEKYYGVPEKEELEDGTIREIYPKGSLIYRAENLPADPKEDNMLKIFSDARKAGLDMRLIDPSFDDFEGSKVNIAVDNILKLHKEWGEDRGVQLVFLDLSTPKATQQREKARIENLYLKADAGDDDAANKLEKMNPDEIDAILYGNFSVYDDVKEKLIKKGIPENEVAFIHDYNTKEKKTDLFEKVNSGKIRVLMGSTSKMGAGTNVQERAVAEHHLDVPWKPSDLEQREGRIIRQGNSLYEKYGKDFKVEIHRYATEKTLDALMWQTVEGKAAMIQQVRNGSLTGREMEDISGEAASAGEMKAASSGNQDILKEKQLRDSLKKLEGRKAMHRKEQARIEDALAKFEWEAERIPDEIEKLKKDISSVEISKDFEMKVDGKQYLKMKDAADAILPKLESSWKDMLDDEVYIGELYGMSIYGTVTKEDGLIMLAKGERDYERPMKLIDFETHGGVIALVNTIKKIETELDFYNDLLKTARAEIPALKKQLKPFKQEGEMERLREAHKEVFDRLREKKDQNKKDKI